MSEYSVNVGLDSLRDLFPNQLDESIQCGIYVVAAIVHDLTGNNCDIVNFLPYASYGKAYETYRTFDSLDQLLDADLSSNLIHITELWYIVPSLSHDDIVLDRNDKECLISRYFDDIGGRASFIVNASGEIYANSDWQTLQPYTLKQATNPDYDWYIVDVDESAFVGDLDVCAEVC